MRSILAGLLILTCLLPADGQRVLVEWRLGSADALQAWRANRDVMDVRVENGVLKCRGAGSDPILEYVRPFEIPATPWQAVEVRMKADHDGQCVLFWSNTTQSAYGGFFPEKNSSFAVCGDGEWRTYRVLPFWQKEGKIIRLRFDPYDGARFEIEFIRIVDLAQGRPAVGAQPALAAIDGTTVRTGSYGTTITATTPDGFAAGPVAIDADKQTLVAVRAAAGPRERSVSEPSRRAAVVFATAASYGLHEVPLMPVPGDSSHTYNVDMLASPEWKGKIVALGVRPGDRSGDSLKVEWIRASDRPLGPADLRVWWFGVEDAMPRAGAPVTVSARVSNSGGSPARGIRPALTLPPGAHILAGAGDSQDLAFGQEAEWRWRVAFKRAGRTPMKLRLIGDGGVGAEASSTAGITSRVGLRGSALPKPRPLRGKYEVGVYYFPGWKSSSQWAPITRYPERKPVLGWYREGDPNVADWQIRWAVEHGITFFAYDWYWSRGSRQLEHALDDGFLQSKYRRLMKFCLLWANHNAAGTSSVADSVAVTRYWIDHYFRQPEYLRYQGRPVVIIFSPYRYREDLGSDGVRAALDAMRAECRRQGVGEVYLVACVGGPGDGRQAAGEGYDAITAYNWPGLGVSGGSLRAPYESLIGAYRRNWEALTESVSLPMLLPLCGGWDNRAWAGDSALVRYGRSPALFRRHLQSGLEYMESHPGRTLPLAIVEAWNEFGEGSYIEPQREFGFGYLDAIRDVYCGARPGAVGGERREDDRRRRAPLSAHTDLTPADAGVTVPQVTDVAPAKSSWRFAGGLQGWESVMDMTGPTLVGGALTATSTGDDPAFFGPPIQLAAAGFRAIRVRMRMTPVSGPPFTEEAQVFWSTRSTSESEANSIHLRVTGDGAWHDYTADLSSNSRWRSIVTRLRFDPCNRRGVRVEIASIQLISR